jgi:DNA-binding Lrp family transcriptional regulator
MHTTGQVNQYLFNDIAKTTVLRRLRELEKNKFIQRILGLENQQHLWALSGKGANLIGAEFIKGHWNKNILDHDYKLLCLRLKLEELGIAHSWRPEHEIRSLIYRKYKAQEAHKKLIPDGLMTGLRAGNKEAIAIELELSLKNKSRIKEVLNRYQEKKDLGAVWYIASSSTILKAVLGLSKWPGLIASLFDEVMNNPNKAMIYSHRQRMLLMDYWQTKPAHLGALGVSTHHRMHDDHLESANIDNHRNFIARFP